KRSELGLGLEDDRHLFLEGPRRGGAAPERDCFFALCDEPAQRLETRVALDAFERFPVGALERWRALFAQSQLRLLLNPRAQDREDAPLVARVHRRAITRRR